MEEITINCKNSDLKENTISQDRVDQIDLLLCPENIESSKVILLLYENLTVKINELFSLKEISRSCKTINELLQIVEKLPYLKYSEDKEILFYHLLDDMISFSIINVPQNISRNDLLKKLDLEGVPELRLYKKSLFWILTLNADERTRKLIEEKIKNLRFDDGNMMESSKPFIKYDVMTKADFMKTFYKHIQTNSYQKESQSLKANDNNLLQNTKNSKKEKNDLLVSDGKYKGKDKNDLDAFSWRKPSNHETIATQNEEKNTKGSDKISSNVFKNDNRKDSYKRERFNSEGNNGQGTNKFYQNHHNKFQNSQSNQNQTKENSEQIQIDLEDVKYSMIIKHSYTLERMAELFEAYSNSKMFENKPVFNIEVENLYSDNKKECKSFNKIKNRDRSNTITYNSASDTKYKANYYGGHYSSGKNEESNRNRINSCYYTNSENSNSGIKIPMMNPLSNYNKTFNKFDERDLTSRIAGIKVEEHNKYYYNKFN